MGFIVVLWENENIVSVIKEKKVVGALELKEGTTLKVIKKSFSTWIAALRTFFARLSNIDNTEHIYI